MKKSNGFQETKHKFKNGDKIHDRESMNLISWGIRCKKQAYGEEIYKWHNKRNFEK
jgi:hypothetical protein